MNNYQFVNLLPVMQKPPVTSGKIKSTRGQDLRKPVLTDSLRSQPVGEGPTVNGWSVQSVRVRDRQGTSQYPPQKNYEGKETLSHGSDFLVD